MVGSMILLLAIVGKYIRSKVDFSSWHAPYSSPSTTPLKGSNTPVPVVNRKIYDRWLLLRFTIAFFAVRLVDLEFDSFNPIAQFSVANMVVVNLVPLSAL